MYFIIHGGTLWKLCNHSQMFCLHFRATAIYDGKVPRAKINTKYSLDRLLKILLYNRHLRKKKCSTTNIFVLWFLLLKQCFPVCPSLRNCLLRRPSLCHGKVTISRGPAESCKMNKCCSKPALLKKGFIRAMFVWTTNPIVKKCFLPRP
jgi:hypothetical protein